MDKYRKWPWVAQQQWEDILFIHWPVPVDEIRPYVPEPFEIETYDGQAWISIVPFYAKYSKPRGLPGMWPFGSFLELNVRTYVRYKDEEPGVYFFSFDANSLSAVTGARMIFKLPYLTAAMKIKRDGKGVHYHSRRTHEGYPEAVFRARYRPVSQISFAKEGSLSHWLAERYCLWTTIGKKVFKGPILHHPWELQEAELDVEMHGLVDFISEDYVKQRPIVHYCKRKKTYFFPFEVKGELDRTYNELGYLRQS